MKQFEAARLEYHNNTETLAYKVSSIKKVEGDVDLHRLSVIKVYVTKESDSDQPRVHREITISLTNGVKIEYFMLVEEPTTKESAGANEQERLGVFRNIKLTSKQKTSFSNALQSLDLSSWDDGVGETGRIHLYGLWIDMKFEFVDENGNWQIKEWHGPCGPNPPIVNFIESINHKAFDALKSRWHIWSSSL